MALVADRVNAGGRFVQKQNIRLGGQRAGHQDPLLLSAGKLGKKLPAELVGPGLPQALMRPILFFAADAETRPDPPAHPHQHNLET